MRKRPTRGRHARSSHVRRHRQRGIGSAEYIVGTAITLTVLLTPWGASGENVVQRLIHAVQQSQADYAYVVSQPALPRGPGGASVVPGTAVGEGAPGGATPDPGDGATPGEGDPVGAADGSGVPDGARGSDGGGGDAADRNPLPEDENTGGDGGNGGPAVCAAGGGGAEGPTPVVAPLTGALAGAPVTGAGVPTHIAATHVGNPINVITGNKFERQVDLRALPGAGGLTFVRYYNSRTHYTGALGHNWRSNYTLTLQKTRGGLRLWQADGRRIDFTFDHAIAGTTAAVYHAAQYGDGTLTVGAFGTTWHWRDGTTLALDRDGTLLSIRSPAGATTRLSHNAAGQLTRVTDPQGRTLKLAYNADHRLKAIIDPTGAHTTYRYDSQANLTQVTGPDGVIRRYHYTDPHDAHNLTGISRGRVGADDHAKPDHSPRPRLVQAAHARDVAYEPNGPSPTSSHTEPGRAQPESGRARRLIRIATWAYDASDRAVLSMHANGVDKTTLVFKNHQTVVTDSQGQQSVYHTAIKNGVPIVTAIDGPGCSACGGRDVRYRYNNALRLTRVRFADASQAFYRYDGQGRLVKAGYRDATGQVHTVAEFAYQGDSERVVRVASPGVNPDSPRVIAIEYNDALRPSRLIQRGYAPTPDGSFRPVTRARRFLYDDHRRLVAIAGDAGQPLTRLTRGARGVLTGIIRADGTHPIIQARDANGRPTTIEDADQPPLHVRYTAGGRIAAVETGSTTMRYRYDAAGHLAQARLNGYDVTLTHDDAGRLTGIADAQGAVHVAYDAANRITRRQWRDARGNVQAERRYHYNAQGALAHVTDGHGQPVKRGPAGRARSQPAAARNVRHTVRDAAPTPPAAPTIARNPLGRITAVTDARGTTTRRGLDDFGRQVFTASPDAGLTTWHYDAAGRVRRKTRPDNAVAAFDYNPAGQLTTATLPDTRRHFDWTSDTGQLAGITGDTNSERRTYDDANRLIARTRTIGGHHYTTRYHYNAAGQIASEQRPDGTTLDYHYDAHGQLTDIGRDRLFGADRPILTVQSATPGMNRWRFGNGIQTTRRPDRQGRLQSLSIGALHRFVYHHDRQGRITGIDDHGVIVSRYRYDAADRLDFALTPWALYGYRYDANGNRTERVINGHHIGLSYAAHSNRLLGIAAIDTRWHAPLKASTRPIAYVPDTAAPKTLRVTHTAGGDLSSFGARRIAYNANGQPATLYLQGQRIATYQYNSRAQRIAKTVYRPNTPGASPRTTAYLYDHGHLSAEANGQGEITRNYVYWRNRPVAILQDGATYAIHTNHLGAPIAVTDEHRTVIWQAAYAPFGPAFVDADPDGDGQAFTLNLRLPGQYADAESGLYYNHHRYYDPNTGRYISSDPMGIAAGLNTYAYVKNDPINHIDPSGLLLFAFDGTSNADTDANITNVVKFRDAYQADPNEPLTDLAGQPNRADHSYYITGAGRDDLGRSGLDADVGQPDYKNTDLALGDKTDERVMIMADYFFAYINNLNDMATMGELTTDHVNIDITGFSRGASEARIFANLLDSFLGGDDSFLVTDTIGPFNEVADFTSEHPQNTDYGDAASNALRARQFLQQTCFNVNLRFLGLWDTVSHIGVSEENDSRESYGTTGDVFLGIPGSLDYTAHAVAIDERRAIFDSWSIYANPAQKINQIGKKIEKGFVGDHTDIGGAGNGDLSDIALNWIIKQGVDNTSMLAPNLSGDLRKVTSPLVNDVVYQSPAYTPARLYAPGRYFRYLDAGDSTDVYQKDYVVPGSVPDDIDFGRSVEFFIEKNIYKDTAAIRGGDGETMTTLRKGGNGNYAYQQWLKQNYALDIEINGSDLPPGIASSPEANK